MTSLAIILILIAAFFHATWNLLAKRAGGGAVFIWLISALAAAIYAPLAVAIIVLRQPRIGAIQLLFMAGSTILQLVYYLLLQRGYRVGDLSLVYPLARGTGPMLSTIAAIILFGERPTPLALSGAVLIAISVFVLAGEPGKLRGLGARRAVGYGIATGITIAAYTLWDKHAVSALLVPPLVFDWSTSVGRTALLAPLALRRWEEVRREWRTHRREALGVAVLSPLAYILVL
ncbi:MAG: EamA family transporter, partial [Deinococcus sp.]|nr:EamA family transporter [Deinococcus sp.]